MNTAASHDAEIDLLIANLITEFPPPQESKFEKHKHRIARLIAEQGYPVAEVCRLLVKAGLLEKADPSQLRKWLRRRGDPDYKDRLEPFRLVAIRILTEAATQAPVSAAATNSRNVTPAATTRVATPSSQPSRFVSPARNETTLMTPKEALNDPELRRMAGLPP